MLSEKRCAPRARPTPQPVRTTHYTWCWWEPQRRAALGQQQQLPLPSGGGAGDATLQRTATNDAMSRAQAMSEASAAQEQSDAAQERIDALESSLDPSDREAIEQLIADALEDGDDGNLEQLSSGLGLEDEDTARTSGGRYSKEYYAAREAEIVTPERYGGGYAAALARNKLEAQERGALEVKDAENRKLERQSKMVSGMPPCCRALPLPCLPRSCV